MADMIKVGGLWANKDKDGNSYLTGKLNPGVKILIFKNRYRESENHPTHILYLAPVEQAQGQGNAGDEFESENAADLLGDPRTDRPIQRQAPRGAAPAPAPSPAPARPAHQSRQAAAPTAYDDDLDDPFADDDRPISRGQRQPAPF